MLVLEVRSAVMALEVRSAVMVLEVRSAVMVLEVRSGFCLTVSVLYTWHWQRAGPFQL